MAEETAKTHSPVEKGKNGQYKGTVQSLIKNGKCSKAGKTLLEALNKKNTEQIKEQASKLLTESIHKTGSWTKFTEQEFQVLVELAANEKLRQTLQLKDGYILEILSEDDVTGVDSGSAKVDDHLPPPDKSAVNPSSQQKVDLIDFEKISKDRLREIEELKRDIERLNEEVERRRNRMLEKDNEFTKLQEEKKKLSSENALMSEKVKSLHEEVKDLSQKLQDSEKQTKEQIDSLSKEYEAEYEDLKRHNKRKFEEMKNNHDKEIRGFKDKIREITEEREDLKTRFSKLAGQKLTDQNADIADLSDPNRAMKLSEMFGQLYDDEWTDAFEYLKKKMSVQDAITLLIRMLKDCLQYCNSLSGAQMDSLKIILLHPSQDMSQFSSEPSKNIVVPREMPVIGSEDYGVVCAVRRKIGVYDSVKNVVKKRFVQETKTWEKQGYDKKDIEACSPYLQKCVEICWLMMIHCPPLYIKLDVQQGDPLDINYFSNYATPSEKVEYLVWPPLFNEKNGGLLKKGVAEGMKDK